MDGLAGYELQNYPNMSTEARLLAKGISQKANCDGFELGLEPSDRAANLLSNLRTHYYDEWGFNRCSNWVSIEMITQEVDTSPNCRFTGLVRAVLGLNLKPNSNRELGSVNRMTRRYWAIRKQPNQVLLEVGTILTVPPVTLGA